MVTFGNPASLTTTATFSAAGAFILRLTASNDQGTATSDVTITVNPTSTTQPPQAPVVNAGAGQMIQLPTNTVTLNGSVQNPSGGSLTIAWSQVSGPATATFSSPTQAVTQASFTTAGTYLLKLSASNGQFTSSATVSVIVVAATPNSVAAR